MCARGEEGETEGGERENEGEREINKCLHVLNLSNNRHKCDQEPMLTM